MWPKLKERDEERCVPAEEKEQEGGSFENMESYSPASVTEVERASGRLVEIESNCTWGQMHERICVLIPYPIYLGSLFPELLFQFRLHPHFPLA